MLANRFIESPLVRKNDALRSFAIGTWLGWQIESNWADPFLFAVYSIARPVASVLILVVMYNVITNGATGEPIFAYMYLGNALYILVAAIITGVSWVIIDDREHYRVSKQLHTIPMSHFFYLLGRGVARLLIGLISVLITIGFGVVAFKLPVHLLAIDWGLLLLSMVLGVITLACMGLIMGALTMMMARHFWSIGEAVAGALYLFTGAIFPLETLPVWLQPVGYMFPITYWLELSRRAILGAGAAAFPTFAAYSNAHLLGILLAFAVGLSVASVLVYKGALYQAKEKGLLDMESSY